MRRSGVALAATGAALLFGGMAGSHADEAPATPPPAAMPVPAAPAAIQQPPAAQPPVAPPVTPPPAGQPPANPGTPSPAAGPVVREDADGLTLEQAVDYAVRNNPRVGEAAARVREAQALVIQRKAIRGPQFGVNNFVFRQGPVVPSQVPGGNPAVPAFRWNYGIFVNQILFDFGQRANAERAQRKRTEAAAQNVAETRNDVRFVVASTYFDVFRAREILAVAEERRKATAEQLRVARARFEQDIAPRFDVLRAEAELASAEQDVISAQNDISLAESSFNNALGRDVATPVRLQYQTPSSPGTGTADLTLEQARELAVRNRPQLEALRRTLQADEAEIRSRRAENRPQVSLGATFDRPNPGGFASTPSRYSTGLVMTFPFFDNGLTRGRVREAQAFQERDRATLERLRQQVDLDVRQALLDISEARQRITTSEKELVSAREALRVAEVRYRSGVGTTVEVTDAQLAVSRAGQNLANSRFDLDAATARLQAATGTPAVPIPIPPKK